MCRTAESQGGFTLLELVVVLVIMGLAAALAAPNLMRSIDSWQASAELDRLADQIEGLPAKARGQGRALSISQDSLARTDAPLRVEQGWTVSTPTAWLVRANGYCAGGDVVLREKGREWRLRAVAPFCTVERDPP